MKTPQRNSAGGFSLPSEQNFESLIHFERGVARDAIETGVVRSFPLKQTAGANDADRISEALTLLRGGRRSERIGAARELGDIALTKGIKIPGAVVPMTVTLASDPDPSVREEAAWSLWKLADARSHKPLMDALLNDKSYAVREKCARVLGLMGVKGSRDVMLDLLTLERHVPGRVRAGIACAFGYLADESLLEQLIRLARDPEPNVRYDAVRSLGRYLVGFSGEVGARVFKLLKRHMKRGHEPCGLIRKAAVKALRFSSGRDACAAVVKALRRDPDEEVRQTAAEALIIWDGAATEAALIAALADDCWQVRKSASRTLSKFIMRYRVYDSAAVCEALRRIERMLPAHSLEWRLAADAFASL